MDKNVLIVEDQFIEANDLKIMLEKAGYSVCGIARSVSKALALIETQKPALVLVDIFLKGSLTGIDLAIKLKEAGIAFIFISANSNTEILEAAKATQPYGFLVKPFREKDLLIMLDIAQYRHENSVETNLRKEAKLKEELMQLAALESTSENKLRAVCRSLQQFVPFDFILAGDWEHESNTTTTTGLSRVGFNEYQGIGRDELNIIAKTDALTMEKLHRKIEASNEYAFFTEDNFKKYSLSNEAIRIYSDIFRLQALLVMPVRLTNGKIKNFYFFSRRANAYTSEHLLTAKSLSITLSSVLETIYMGDKVTETKTGTHSKENGKPEIRDFEGIIGNSPQLLTVLDHLTQVAAVDTSVLILGESGTGKERIVDYIHQLSPRKNKPLIKINCAALPASLVESELFGHEKGAFTGATSQRSGKFELANGGTLFLDEIGELPLELQSKLLRVLQEKEIERIGGGRAIKTDIRIVAATNRNLETEVGEGRFRLDLYYRLNVFPLEMPALRERKEDIPLLIEHFIRLYNRKANKNITHVSDTVLDQMLAYEWPGNIRELENTIERAVVLTKDLIINEVSLPGFSKEPNNNEKPQYLSLKDIKTIQDNERDHIIAVLKFCKGKIWGEGGAAALLNIPPTTLNSRMKKLGIHKEHLQ